MGENISTFCLGGVEIAAPPRTATLPSNPTDEAYLKMVETEWPGLCRMAYDHLSRARVSSMMRPESFNPNSAGKVFAFSKERIRKVVLRAEVEGVTAGRAYRYYVLGQPVELAPSHAPALRITRLELFQLLALFKGSQFQAQQIRQQLNLQLTAEERRAHSLHRMLTSLPEKGGPLMTANQF